MNASKPIAILLVGMTVACPLGHAYVELPKIFAHHMVLQAEKPLPIWGTASPKEPIIVTLGEQNKKTTAGIDGNWRVLFPPRLPTSEPNTIRVQGHNNEIVIEDVLVGEVWLCAGQSNMEWPLKNATNGHDVVGVANHPQIRLLNFVGAARGGAGSYTAEHLARLTPQLFCRGRWAICTPESASFFSAVGYYFGRKLQQELKVPIGLISPAIGGTPAEAWIRRDAMAGEGELAPLVQGDWLKNSQLDAWCQRRAEGNLLRARESGEHVPGDELGPNHSFKPAFMWESGVSPLVPYAIQGVIWYQGESNAASHWRAMQHSQLFPVLVRDWREQWGQGDFSFFYVQLPALGRPHWPVFREGQRRMLDKLPNVGMAVTMDIGHRTNVHPIDKQPVGERLARWALAETYGRAVTASGPLFQLMQVVDQRAILTFKYAGQVLTTRDQLAPVGFEVAGEEGVYFPAKAQIEGDTIIVSSAKVLEIANVRYGWEAFPDPPLNLINSEGLPASPFTTAASLLEARN